MRLNDAITTVGMSALVGAESMKLHAYSAFTLLFMVNTGANPKALRSMLSVKAMDTGVIAKNTWESYVKGVEDAAGKLSANLANEPTFQGIFTMARNGDVEGAVDGVRELYESLNILSGSDIRLWSKVEEFGPLDKAADKAAKAAADKARRDAKARTDAEALLAHNPLAIADMGTAAPAAPANPLDALAALLGTMGEADLLKALTAVNDRIAFLDAAKARPADKVAPVLADNVAPDAKSALAAHFNRKSA